MIAMSAANSESSSAAETVQLDAVTQAAASIESEYTDVMLPSSTCCWTCMAAQGNHAAQTRASLPVQLELQVLSTPTLGIQIAG